MDTCLILVMVFIAIILLVYVVVCLRNLHITACGVEELRLIRDAKDASDAAHEETKILLQESRASTRSHAAELDKLNGGIKKVEELVDTAIEFDRNQGAATDESLTNLTQRMNSIRDTLRNLQTTR